MEMKGISSSILITTSPLTEPAVKEIEKLQETNKNIFVLNLNDMIDMKKTPINILEEKIIEKKI